MRGFISFAIIGVALSGCATTSYDVEWSHEDESRNWDSDAYDCELQALKRGASIISTPDLQKSDQFVECMIRKYGWTRIARSVMK